MNERIRKLRKALGLTLEKFGLKIGVKKNTVSQIETGKNNVTEQVIASIINADWDGKKINEEWLRDGTGEMFIKQSPDEQIATFIGGLLKDEEDSFKRRLISGLCGLDDDGWRILERFIDSIQKKKD